MVGRDEAMRHATGWIDAWNRRDLDAILAHYADDVLFQAPTVARRWQRPDGILHGREDLREHFRRGLEIAADLRFEFEDLLLGTQGYTLIYRRENGNRVAEAVRLDDDGKAAEVHVYYAAGQA